MQLSEDKFNLRVKFKKVNLSLLLSFLSPDDEESNKGGLCVCSPKVSPSRWQYLLSVKVHESERQWLQTTSSPCISNPAALAGASVIGVPESPCLCKSALLLGSLCVRNTMGGRRKIRRGC